ncbi:Siderophore iron transporter mirA [Fusarium odoratissimum]|uniref:Siderophore iron transporter mirA n=1 Tax=Fusarium oxysporum f. sp. cubense (strain race 4) TaxID=2502994 RepID=N1RL95_FUSC4|nr:Siderophore iron transporter mirA [Fusarium odoratissimum]
MSIAMRSDTQRVELLFAATFLLNFNFNKFSSGTYIPFATSNFQRYSALSTANVVGAIMSMVAFPILAKFFSVSLLYICRNSLSLWSNLPKAIATIPTLYLGTLVAEEMLEHSTWQWGY